MLRIPLLGLVTAALAACAAQPAPDAEKDMTVVNQSTVCDRELTGSHFKRCARDGAAVEVISREQLEMIRNRTSNMPMEPGTARGR